MNKIKLKKELKELRKLYYKQKATYNFTPKRRKVVAVKHISLCASIIFTISFISNFIDGDTPFYKDKQKYVNVEEIYYDENGNIKDKFSKYVLYNKEQDERYLITSTGWYQNYKNEYEKASKTYNLKNSNYKNLDNQTILNYIKKEDFNELENLGEPIKSHVDRISKKLLTTDKKIYEKPNISIYEKKHNLNDYILKEESNKKNLEDTYLYLMISFCATLGAYVWLFAMRVFNLIEYSKLGEINFNITKDDLIECKSKIKSLKKEIHNKKGN